MSYICIYSYISIPIVMYRFLCICMCKRVHHPLPFSKTRGVNELNHKLSKSKNSGAYFISISLI